MSQEASENFIQRDQARWKSPTVVKTVGRQKEQVYMKSFCEHPIQGKDLCQKKHML